MMMNAVYTPDRRKVMKTAGNGLFTGKTNALRPWTLRLAGSATGIFKSASESHGCLAKIGLLIA